MGQRIEEAHQAAVFDWAAWVGKQVHPELDMMFHIPNGGKRGKAEAAAFKRMGVKPGVCDIFLSVARGGYHGLYIEMKRPGGRMEESQDDFIRRAREEGYMAEVCRGFDEAKGVIEGYLALPKEKKGAGDETQ